MSFQDIYVYAKEPYKSIVILMGIDHEYCTDSFTTASLSLSNNILILSTFHKNVQFKNSFIATIILLKFRDNYLCKKGA